MNTLVAEYWIWLVLALVIGLIVAWYVFHASRKTNVTGTSKDVLDDGADRAERNRALIDSAPAATREPDPPTTAMPATEGETIVPVAAPTGLAGTGAAVAAAADAAETKSAPAEAETQSAPAPVDPAPPVAATSSPQDGTELTRLKGVGPKLAARLNELGVTSVGQIAAWSESDIDRIDPELGRFQGRIRRDAWVEQAKLLESGDTGGYEGKFGKLD